MYGEVPNGRIRIRVPNPPKTGATALLPYGCPVAGQE